MMKMALAPNEEGGKLKSASFFFLQVRKNLIHFWRYERVYEGNYKWGGVMTWYFYFDVEFERLCPKPCDATKVFSGLRCEELSQN